ncbi:MAG: TIGR02996 domain-containing protein [Gemmataceae bacterium]
MPDHASFIAAIVANPKDDVARLVYADWLDEQGDPRGEFIRVQIDLLNSSEPEIKTPGRLSHESTELYIRRNCVACCRVKKDCKWHALQKRENELLRQLNFDPECIDSFVVTSTPALPISYALVTRGFVSHVQCTAANWIAHADVITAVTPIESVELTTAFEINVSPGLIGISSEGASRSAACSTLEIIAQMACLSPLALVTFWPEIEFMIRQPPHNLRQLIPKKNGKQTAAQIECERLDFSTFRRYLEINASPIYLENPRIIVGGSAD